MESLDYGQEILGLFDENPAITESTERQLTSYADAIRWMDDLSDQMGSRTKFLSSPQFKSRQSEISKLKEEFDTSLNTWVISRSHDGLWRLFNPIHGFYSAGEGEFTYLNSHAYSNRSMAKLIKYAEDIKIDAEIDRTSDIEGVIQNSLGLSIEEVRKLEFPKKGQASELMLNYLSKHHLNDIQAELEKILGWTLESSDRVELTAGIIQDKLTQNNFFGRYPLLDRVKYSAELFEILDKAAGGFKPKAGEELGVLLELCESIESEFSEAISAVLPEHPDYIHASRYALDAIYLGKLTPANIIKNIEFDQANLFESNPVKNEFLNLHSIKNRLIGANFLTRYPEINLDSFTLDLERLVSVYSDPSRDLLDSEIFALTKKSNSDHKQSENLKRIYSNHPEYRDVLNFSFKAIYRPEKVEKFQEQIKPNAIKDKLSKLGFFERFKYVDKDEYSKWLSTSLINITNNVYPINQNEFDILTKNLREALESNYPDYEKVIQAHPDFSNNYILANYALIKNRAVSPLKNQESVLTVDPKNNPDLVEFAQYAASKLENLLAQLQFKKPYTRAHGVTQLDEKIETLLEGFNSAAKDGKSLLELPEKEELDRFIIESQKRIDNRISLRDWQENDTKLKEESRKRFEDSKTNGNLTTRIKTIEEYFDFYEFSIDTRDQYIYIKDFMPDLGSRIVERENRNRDFYNKHGVYDQAYFHKLNTVKEEKPYPQLSYLEKYLSMKSDVLKGNNQHRELARKVKIENYEITTLEYDSNPTAENKATTNLFKTLNTDENREILPTKGELVGKATSEILKNFTAEYFDLVKSEGSYFLKLESGNRVLGLSDTGQLITQNEKGIRQVTMAGSLGILKTESVSLVPTASGIIIEESSDLDSEYVVHNKAVDETNIEIKALNTSSLSKVSTLFSYLAYERPEKLSVESLKLLDMALKDSSALISRLKESTVPLDLMKYEVKGEGMLETCLPLDDLEIKWLTEKGLVVSADIHKNLLAKARELDESSPSPNPSLELEPPASHQDTVFNIKEAKARKISDTGYIPGAAKERWGKFGTAVLLPSTLDQIVQKSFSEIFPVLDPEKLRKEELPEKDIKALIALRSSVSRKPSKNYKVKSWAKEVLGIKNLASMLIEEHSREEFWNRIASAHYKFNRGDAEALAERYMPKSTSNSDEAVIDRAYLVEQIEKALPYAGASEDLQYVMDKFPEWKENLKYSREGVSRNGGYRVFYYELRNRLSELGIVQRSDLEAIALKISLLDAHDLTHCKTINDDFLIKRFVPARQQKTYQLMSSKGRFIGESFDTVSEVIEESKELLTKYAEEKLENVTTRAKRPKTVKPIANLQVYRESNRYFLGFKGKAGVSVARYAPEGISRRELAQWKTNVEDEVLKELEDKKGIKLRGEENRARTGGKDWRVGKDITEDQLKDAFKLREVQFGNSTLSSQKEAQQKINQTYDALMDLADVLGLSPKAIGLGGRLSIAIGARGKGGKQAAMAHYEPGYVVINLTRRNGAGSLAHEWFHAVDNYFGKYAELGFEQAIKGAPLDSYGTNRRNNHNDTSSMLRPEIKETFLSIVNGLTGEFLEASKMMDNFRSGKPYWSKKIEMAARAFESYVKIKMHEKGLTNDFLVNVNASLDPEIKELYGIVPNAYALSHFGLKDAFDSLFEQVNEEELEDGVVLKKIESLDSINITEKWMEIAASDSELFRFNDSGEKSIERLFSANGYKIESEPALALPLQLEGVRYADDITECWELTSPLGHTFWAYETTDKCWLDLSELKSKTIAVGNKPMSYGGKGNGHEIYQLLSCYAYNTGKTFVADPVGLSEVAMVRRTENMLCSALRYGTTKHISPSEQQIRGVNEVGRRVEEISPLPWSADDRDNIEALITTSYENVVRNIPEISSIVYNTQRQEYIVQSDNGFTHDNVERIVNRLNNRVDNLEWDIEALVQRDLSPIEKSLAGKATIQRALVTKTLLTEENSLWKNNSRAISNYLPDLIESYKTTNSLAGILYRDEVTGKLTDLTEINHSNTVREWIEPVELDTGVKITVVPTAGDLPQRLRKGLPKSVPGLFDVGTNTPYLIADRINSRPHAIKTALHEGLGHSGVLSFLKRNKEQGGAQLESILDQIYNDIGMEALSTRLKEYKFNFDDQSNRREAVLEYIAHLAESGNGPKVVNAYVNGARNLFETLYDDVAWTDHDLLDLIEVSRLSGLLNELTVANKLSDELSEKIKNTSEAIEKVFSANPKLRQLLGSGTELIHFSRTEEMAFSKGQNLVRDQLKAEIKANKLVISPATGDELALDKPIIGQSEKLISQLSEGFDLDSNAVESFISSSEEELISLDTDQLASSLNSYNKTLLDGFGFLSIIDSDKSIFEYLDLTGISGVSIKVNDQNYKLVANTNPKQSNSGISDGLKNSLLFAIDTAPSELPEELTNYYGRLLSSNELLEEKNGRFGYGVYLAESWELAEHKNRLSQIDRAEKEKAILRSYYRNTPYGIEKAIDQIVVYGTPVKNMIARSYLEDSEFRRFYDEHAESLIKHFVSMSKRNPPAQEVAQVSLSDLTLMDWGKAIKHQPSSLKDLADLISLDHEASGEELYIGLIRKGLVTNQKEASQLLKANGIDGISYSDGQQQESLVLFERGRVQAISPALRVNSNNKRTESLNTTNKARALGFDTDIIHYRAQSLDTSPDDIQKEYGLEFGIHLGSKRTASLIAGDDEMIEPVYSKSINPLRLPDLQNWNVEDVIGELQGLGILKPYNDLTSADQRDLIISSIFEAGYDSIIYRNEFDDIGSDTTIVFSEDQVRSANDLFSDALDIASPVLYKKDEELNEKPGRFQLKSSDASLRLELERSEQMDLAVLSKYKTDALALSRANLVAIEGLVGNEGHLLDTLRTADIDILKIGSDLLEFMPSDITASTDQYVSLSSKAKRAEVLDTRFLFLGTASATEVQHSALSTAKSMLLGNASSSDIWKQTGWVKGADGEWRFEVDDSQASIDLSLVSGFEKRVFQSIDPESETQKSFLSEILDHEELYSRYPGIKDLEVELRHTDNPRHRGGLNLTPAPKVVLFVHPIYSSIDTIKSTLLHEVQHIIQVAEGMAKGGEASLESMIQLSKTNESFLLSKLDLENSGDQAQSIEAIQKSTQVLAYAKLTHLLKDREGITEDLVKRHELYPRYENKLVSDLGNPPKPEYINLQKQYWQDATLKLVTLISQDFQHRYGQSITEITVSQANETIDKKSLQVLMDSEATEEVRTAKAMREELRNVISYGKQKDIEKTYLSLSGEVEARNVQARMNMDAAIRESVHPEESADISKENQLPIKDIPDQTLLRKLTGTNDSEIEFKVVEKSSDLPEMALDAIDGLSESPLAMIDKGKTVYLFKDQINKSNRDIKETVAHELAHISVRSVFGSGLAKEYSRFWEAIGEEAGLHEEARLADLNMEQYFELADSLIKRGTLTNHGKKQFLVDEFIAHSIDSRSQEKISQKAKRVIKEWVGGVRNLARKQGLVKLSKITNADLAYTIKTVNESMLGKKVDKPRIISDRTPREIQQFRKLAHRCITAFNVFDKSEVYELSVNSDPTNYPIAESIKLISEKGIKLGKNQIINAFEDVYGPMMDGKSEGYRIGMNLLRDSIQTNVSKEDLHDRIVLIEKGFDAVIEEKELHLEDEFSNTKDVERAVPEPNMGM